MKKLCFIFVLVIVAAFVACEQHPKVDSAYNGQSDFIKNFRNSGVDIYLENMPTSRTSELTDSYYVTMDAGDGVDFEGVIDVSKEPSDNTTVSLYATSKDDLYDELLGAYTVNDSLVVVDVIVGDTTYVIYADPNMVRQPGEKFKECVKREYNEMKLAYEERPLDDIACTILAGGLVCKALALIVAASECSKN